ncbi:two-component system LytT family sensor kinase [Microbacterium keratanolyticum]|uniref:Signal transduction histidine kinase n=2 Tax=Microbacterium keratanolyticum TaxID=67574 RepID=A0A9W6HQL0_9MICO|nr:histidine kinase [Microbacterium keratanolyticum]MBM7468520.1 two-component system LytT family sensor kinase [Microbacterium keratanolyticum]GLK00595.1 signal transduction histidine kinase [Microbacterium keratanolyticum]
MTDVVLAAVFGALGGIALTLLLLLVRRLARGGADLGSEAEQATLRALHQASLAAPHLRGGLSGPDVVKASRHLRVLLGSAAVAIVSEDDSVWFDGASDGLESAARRIAAQVRASGRRQVFPSPRQQGALEAVGAPIRVDDQVVGVLVAFAERVPATLVRAAEEVADWCAAQLALGGLDASRTQLAEAELRSLRAQISPHFIYNALTAIASFILTDPARARELVLEFADFTRYSFRRKGEFTTLAEELGSIHSYLELERARFGDRLRVTLQIAPETLATVIPFLSVQPLVENAVRHGLEPGEGGGEIRIIARDVGVATEITVEDDGVGMDPTALQATLTAADDGLHVGLRNVDTRLRQLYGSEGGLVVETNTGAGTLVRMQVPKSQPLHDPESD